MQIRARLRGIEDDDGLRVRLERRVHFALGRFDARIARVEARLDDVNGPRGGADKRCALVVRLRSGGELRVEELDGSFDAAVDRASDRLGRAVARELERRRLRARDPGRSSLADRREITRRGQSRDGGEDA